MIPRRAWVVPIMASLILIGCGVRARAAEFPCWKVKFYVAAYGEAAALQWARSNHYSERQIATARKCLAQ